MIVVKKIPSFWPGIEDSVQTTKGEANAQELHTYRKLVYTAPNEVTIPTHV